MELRPPEDRTGVELDVELLARRPGDLLVLGAMEEAFQRVGLRAQLTASAGLRAARPLAPGPRACRARLVVAGSQPMGEASRPDGHSGVRVALWDSLELHAPVAALDELGSSDLVLVPEEAQARALADRTHARIQAVGSPRLEALLRDPALMRARTRRRLGLPEGETLVAAVGATEDTLDAVHAAPVVIGLLRGYDTDAESARLLALAGRRARVLYIDAEDVTHGLAASDVLVAPRGELAATAIALGLPWVDPSEASPDSLAVRVERAAAEGRRPPQRDEAGAAERVVEAVRSLLGAPERETEPSRACDPRERRDLELRAAFGDAEGALAELEQELRRTPSAGGFLRQARLLRGEGRLDEAAAAAERACARGASVHARALCERARVAVEQGRAADAALDFERAAGLAPELADPSLGLGSLALHAGDPERARGLFERALAREPSSRAHSGLGLAQLSLAAPREALGSFERALGLEPDCIAALYGMVQAAFETGELALAERRLASFLELHPANLDMLFTAAGLRFALGRLEAARELVERIELFDADYPGLAELRAKLED
jgi:tetratricopeptide (TPR) repeat protein